MGFLARECGWSHKYILDNFTLDQLYAYYGWVQKVVMREERLKAQVISQSAAFAFGTLKVEDFDTFLNQLYHTPENLDKVLQEAKEAGLPVEDGNG